MDSLKILIFDEEKLTATLIESYLTELTFNYDLEKYNEFDENLINNLDVDKIIIVNINKTNTDILKKITALSHDKRNNFIIISYDNNTDILVKSLRTGACDFLLKPLIKADFVYAVNKIYKKNIKNSLVNKKAVISAVISPDKGIGKTFFLVNLSKILSDISNEKILLIDFNYNFNDISFMLDLKPVYNVSHFIENIDKENSVSMLSKILQYKNSSLFIMPNNIYNNKNVINNKKLDFFFETLSKMFKYIFIDVNPLLTETNDIVLNNTDIIYCLVQAKINCFEQTKKMLNTKYSKKNIRIILNKYNSKDIMLINEFEEIINKEIFWKIPKNFMAASIALSRGKTLNEVNPQMDIVKSYSQLAEYILNRD